MPSSLEIAQAAVLQPIDELAAATGLSPDEIEPYGRTKAKIDLSVLDRKIMVSNHDAIVWTQRLLHDEGMFAGVSTGAIAAIAVRIANELDQGNVVFIAPDDGWKYLSSGLYTRPVEEIANLDSTVWW